MEDIEIIDNSPEAISQFHKRGWGGENLELSIFHLMALLEGKCLAFFDGEYTHCLTLELSRR